MSEPTDKRLAPHARRRAALTAHKAAMYATMKSAIEASIVALHMANASPELVKSLHETLAACDAGERSAND